MDIMDFLAFFFAITLITFLSPNAQAAIVPLEFPSGLVMTADKLSATNVNSIADLYTRLSASPTGIPIDSKVTIPTSNGLKSVPLSGIRLTPNLPRLAKAVTGLGKSLAWVGAAVALKEVVCSLSNICDDPVTNLPTITSNDYLFRTNGLYPSLTAAISCNSFATEFVKTNAYDFYVMTQINANQFTCYFRKRSNNDLLSFPTIKDSEITHISKPVTIADWDNAELKFASPLLVKPLIDSGIALPIDSPELPSPASLPLEKTTTTTRNPAGTATGTEVRERTLLVEPNPLSPSTAKTSETTIITNYDTTNNITNSTTSIINNDNAPDDAAEPPKIEIDEVKDIPITNQDHDTTFSYTPWGSSSTCPPNPTASLSIGTFSLPVDRVCDFMDMARPIILLLAFLAAASIISGAKYE